MLDVNEESCDSVSNATSINYKELNCTGESRTEDWNVSYRQTHKSPIPLSKTAGPGKLISRNLLSTSNFEEASAIVSREENKVEIIPVSPLRQTSNKGRKPQITQSTVTIDLVGFAV